MNIAFAHANMDFDCFGSLLLVKKLFPDYRLVRSSRIQPAAQNIYDFYAYSFDFLTLKDISGEKIENIIIVDTCMAARVSEYFSHIKNCTPAIRIFDHHRLDNCDIPGAFVEGGNFGSTTTLLGKMAMEKGITLSNEEATIAMTGIYADTGRLLYENVTKADYEVSAWLLDMGASLKLVKAFLESVKEDEQIAVFNQIRPIHCSIQGHSLILSFLELEKNVAGLAEVVEKIMDVQNPEAYFAVFSIPAEKRVLLIARSQNEHIDVEELLAVYGGGGHQLAASAKITCQDGKDFFDAFRLFLDYALKPAARAKDIMTKYVFLIHESTSLMEASMYLERLDITAVPVAGAEGNISGFISLRDIMKGRKLGKMQSPVKAFMSKPVIYAGSTATIKDIEKVFFKNKISYLPIIDNGKLLGIVSRWDYLQFKRRSSANHAGLR